MYHYHSRLRKITYNLKAIINTLAFFLASSESRSENDDSGEVVSVSNVTEALQKKEVGQVTDGLCVFRNEKGRAICTTKIIKKGERVCQYVGELISYREGCKREVKLDPSLGSYMYFFQKGNRRLCLDATDEKKFPSFGRLINHSKKKLMYIHVLLAPSIVQKFGFLLSETLQLEKKYCMIIMIKMKHLLRNSLGYLNKIVTVTKTY